MATTAWPQGWTWEGVLDRLEEHADIDLSAREHGAIRRTRVIKTGGQLLRLVLAYVLSGLSLRGTVAWAEAADQASFSDVAFLKRLRRCGPWLAYLVGRLQAAANPEASCEAGCLPPGHRRVVAVDATTISSPGGQHKSYKVLHTVYEIGAQRFVTTLMTDRKVAEHLDVGTVVAGEIRLGDRVYGRYRDLAAVQGAGADYVVRLSANALRLETPDGMGARTPLDRAVVCGRAEREGTQDVAVVIADAHGRPPLNARVIVLPLPSEQAEAARRVMRKKAQKAGYTPSSEALVTAGCLMLITSLPAADWPAARILALYRRRWQVELAFKRLKSLLDLERLRVFDSDLVQVWIHAVLLVALLVDLERPSVKTERPDSPRSVPRSTRGRAACHSGASSHSSPAA